MKTMNSAIATLVSLCGLSAQAEVISCHFTEPFYTIKIDTLKRTVVRIEPNWDKDGSETVTTVISKNAQVRFAGVQKISDTAHMPIYKVISNGQVIMKLELSYQGSDGMSDITYPYNVNGGTYNYGGCESETLKAIRPL